MRQRKIPTLIGLILVGLAVLTFRFAFDRVTPLFSRAQATHTPQNVTISNVTDTTFTVSWVTSEPVTGAIILEGTPNTTILDDRQTVPGAPTNAARTTHHVTARNLRADTPYAVRILSGGKTFGNNASPYEIRTAPVITGTGSNLEPAYGQVTLPTDQPAEGAILYLTPNGAQTLSVIVKSSGSWVIPLNLVRTSDLSAYLPGAERIDESIIVRDATGEATALTDTLNDNPVPTITIGKTYDFRKIQAMATPTRAIALAPTPTTQPTVLGISTTASGTVAIVKPQQNAALSSNLPLIQGTGIPGKKVSLLLGIAKPISATVTVGTDGVWYFTPPKPLAEGKQSVTITTVDAKGKTVAITHNFQILKSGTQVLGDATPSATLTPSPTIAFAETPTPTATLAGEPVPITGSPLPLIMLLVLGLGLLTGGTMVLLR